MEHKQLSADQTKALRAALPDEAIKQHPTKNYLHTVNPIYVVERLNDVFGVGGWTIHHEIIEREKMVVVKAVFEAAEYGVRLEQFGGNDNPDRGDAFKGACTDALTKIGSYMGIGADVWKDKYKNGQKPGPSPEPTGIPSALVTQVVNAPADAKREYFAKLYTAHVKQPYASALSELVKTEIDKRGLKAK